MKQRRQARHRKKGGGYRDFVLKIQFRARGSDSTKPNPLFLIADLMQILTWSMRSEIRMSAPRHESPRGPSPFELTATHRANIAVHSSKLAPSINALATVGSRVPHGVAFLRRWKRHDVNKVFRAAMVLSLSCINRQASDSAKH